MVYPILLPDPLELLVSLPSGIECYTEPVRFRDIGRTIREFRRALLKRTTAEYREPDAEL
jgi:hypothetical protein